MKESNVGEVYARVFTDYPIWSPNNASNAGWPDRFMLLENSRVVVTELKVFTMNKSNYFRANRFRPTQAAWFAKWQRAGGLCCLFFALQDNDEHLIGYSFMTQQHWRDWLSVPDNKYMLQDRQLFDSDHLPELRRAMVRWFDHRNVIPQVA